MVFTTTRATYKHVADILKSARPEDVREWEAAVAVPFAQSLTVSAFASDPSRAICLTETGEALCLWGCNETSAGVAVGWMVASKRAEENFALALHTVLRDELAIIDARFSLVGCFADARNTKHHEWMRWLGFRLGHEIPQWGPFDLPFYYFERRRPDRQCA